MNIILLIALAFFPSLAISQQVQVLCITCQPVNPCVTCQQDPPVSWAQWGEWGPCTNGGGITAQTRVRGCNALQCDTGLSQEARRCTIVQDPPIPQWTTWGEWGQCSATCGGGIQQRTRVCTTQCGSCTCPGPSTEQRSCNSQSCCTWSGWSAWSECSATCGSGGYKSRTRQCSCYTGCVGHTSEQETCSANIPCAVPTTLPTCVVCQQPTPPPCITCYNPCVTCGYYGRRRRSLREQEMRRRRNIDNARSKESMEVSNNRMLRYSSMRNGTRVY